MSTFDGKVAEFPDIRIDYFRPASGNTKPALAYFLSHVHSDHLIGLETCKSPFIYCSAATRDILLRLEKYPHRMNFAKGILETRKQTYRHLKTLLKAIPLETPTVLELCPGREIKVTLFDANHCVGAVTFLIEGDGKAVLYTGDIRSELWWVNSLTRNPIMLPYVASENMDAQRKLDCIYLDTTFVVSGREEPFAEFPSKADGLRELLGKVGQYPTDTLFYLDAWTFGYEDVWQAVSNFLGSRIHVDDYRYGLYRSLINGVEPKAPEAVKLIGSRCGNHFQEGCLTPLIKACRIHSCEQGTGCDIWNKDFVRITPIVTRHNNVDFVELGAGGGQGDLNQQHELEFDDPQIVGKLMALCASELRNQPQLLSGVLQLLTAFINNPAMPSLKLDGFNLGANHEDSTTGDPILADSDDLPLEKVVSVLSRIVTKMKKEDSVSAVDTNKRPDGLPKQITFPYSRHASHAELCYLVDAFKPREVHPCTVDGKDWNAACSMASLFGHLYDEVPVFRHDQHMFRRKGISSNDGKLNLVPTSSTSSVSEYATPQAGHSGIQGGEGANPQLSEMNELEGAAGLGPLAEQPQTGQGRCAEDAVEHGSENDGRPSVSTKKRKSSNSVPRPASSEADEDSDSPAHTVQKKIRTISACLAEPTNPGIDSENDRQSIPPDPGVSHASSPTSDEMPTSRLGSSPANARLAFRQEVYNAVLGIGGGSWSDIGLISTRRHRDGEEEL